jgi:hypothetical protein
MTTFNPSDKVTVDIPLFIRLLEYAREDAKTDMDLHNVAEKAIAASETGKTLTMADYDGLVAGNSEDQEMNEIKRMQQLAGLIKENEEYKDLSLFQQYLYNYEIEISGEDSADEELKNIKKLNNIDDVIKYYGGYRGWEVDKDLKYELINLIKELKIKFPNLK